jgi:hypothetical protein
MAWALIAAALAMCLRDVAGCMVTVMIAHGRSTWAATFDMAADLGSYLVPVVGIELAGGLHWYAIAAVMCGGWVGTKMGTMAGSALERRLER